MSFKRAAASPKGRRQGLAGHSVIFPLNYQQAIHTVLCVHGQAGVSPTTFLIDSVAMKFTD